MVLSERLNAPNRLGLLAGLAVLGSGGLLLGALWFQYVIGLPPCEMCHWQRWPHIVAVVAGLGALATLSRPRIATALVLTAIAALIVTAGIGVFHAGVENHWWAGPQACSGTIPKGLSPDELRKYLFSAKMVRCDEAAWRLFGISMAGWNAIVSTALAVVLAAGLRGRSA
jgi:disulfide bond formation protein DsbB